MAPGRVTSWFLCALCSILTLVLALSHFLSDDDKTYLAPFYIWETTLFTAASVCIAILVGLRNNTNHMSFRNGAGESTDDSVFAYSAVQEGVGQSGLACWTRFPFRSMFVVITGIGSTILPVYEAVMVVKNMESECSEDISTYNRIALIAQAVSNVLCVLFVLAQTCFVTLLKNKTCMSSQANCSMAIVVATNLTMCANVILNVLKEDNTNEVKDGWLNISDIGYMFVTCVNATFAVDKRGQSVYQFTYQFPVQFVLLSCCWLWYMWNEAQPSRSRGLLESSGNSASYQTFTNQSRSASLESPSQAMMSWSDTYQRYSGIRKLLLKVFIKTMSAVSRYSIYPSFFLAGSVMLFHLVSKVIVQRNGTSNEAAAVLEEAGTDVETGYTYVLCIVAFVGYVIIRQEDSTRRTLKFTDILLIACGFVHLGLILFETVDSIEIIANKKQGSGNPDHVLFYIKVCVHYIGLYSQTMLILKVAAMKLNTVSLQNGKQLLVKGMVVFIGVCNLERWIVDISITPFVMTFVDETRSNDPFGNNWWFVTELTYPFVATFRLLSAIMIFEVCVGFELELLRHSNG